MCANDDKKVKQSNVKCSKVIAPEVFCMYYLGVLLNDRDSGVAWLFVIFWVYYFIPIAISPLFNCHKMEYTTQGLYIIHRWLVDVNCRW